MLKVYEGAPHSMCLTLKDRVNADADLLDYIRAKISASLQFSDWLRNRRRFLAYDGSETVLTKQKQRWVGPLVAISVAVTGFRLADAGSRSQTATAPDQAKSPIRHNVVALARQAEKLIDSGRA